MPHLDGSDKAIEWGRRVRFDLLATAYECMQNDDEFVTGVEEPAKKITSASWWIDQRDADPESLSELVLDAVANPSAVTGSETPIEMTTWLDHRDIALVNRATETLREE